MQLVDYTAQMAKQWNELVAAAKNGHFMFNRSYMDYHADRFTDASVVVLDEVGNPMALLPANVRDGVLYSHQGLSFGGLVMSHKIKASEVLSIFDELAGFLKAKGITKVMYKPVPVIYHRQPAQEDLYVMFRLNAKLYRVDLSTTIDLNSPGKFSNGKRTGLNRAEREGVEVHESSDFARFFEIAQHRMQEKYATSPVHTEAEMTRLHKDFPGNIRLFGGYVNGIMEAGCVVYVSDKVCHAQYIASTNIGRETRAVDAVIGTLVQQTFKDKTFFDFGNSNEEQGRVLNSNLCAQKEEFGGRGTVQMFYEWDISHG